MVKLKNTPKVLGLDISTKTIGWALFDWQSEELLELTHFSPRVKPEPEDKIELLIEKVDNNHQWVVPIAEGRPQPLCSALLTNSLSIINAKILAYLNTILQKI